jgi:hypothetical protein
MQACAWSNMHVLTDVLVLRESESCTWGSFGVSNAMGRVTDS